jgi:uncharacterized membrane protein
MFTYSMGQWILLFFFYSFCGWVWESCYVSLRQKQWVNRGFLYGPMLPIYGSGAIIILFATLPVQTNLFLVWILGLLAATALEYVTGAVMEQMFKVRYWDYSNQKMNIHGYICLSSSIAWGFFSILLIRFIHPPIARILMRIPDYLIDPFALFLTIFATIDAVKSFQAAMDLKETLIRLSEENETLGALVKQAALAQEDLVRFKERTEQERLVLQQCVEAGIQQQQTQIIEHAKNRQAAFEERLTRRIDAKLELLETISNTLQTKLERLEEVESISQKLKQERKAEITEMLEKVQNQQYALRLRSVKKYQSAVRILQSNPSARAGKELQEALEALRSLKD